MRVLVTGATGFIGTALVEQLIGQGAQVRALVRATSATGPLEKLGVELARGDVGDAAAVTSAVEGRDLVIHLAGLIKAMRSAELFRANGEGTRHVAQACAAASSRPRLVYVSSIAAAGPAVEGRPRSEDDPPSPVSHSGKSKLAGEMAVREVAGRIAASIVRPPIVYGPRDREFMPALLRMVRSGLVLRAGFTEKTYSLVHIADLCAGILAVAERGQRVRAEGPEGTYFLDSGGAYGWNAIAGAACQATGRRARVLAVPQFVSAVAAAGSMLASEITRKPSILSFDKVREIRQSAWTCSSDRARREVGFTPRFPLEAGMADAVAWFRTQGLA